MKEHATGRGAKYTRRRGPFKVRYTECLDTKGAALQREAAIKAMDRSAKAALIATALRPNSTRATRPCLPPPLTSLASEMSMSKIERWKSAKS